MSQRPARQAPCHAPLWSSRSPPRRQPGVIPFVVRYPHPEEGNSGSQGICLDEDPPHPGHPHPRACAQGPEDFHPGSLPGPRLFITNAMAVVEMKKCAKVVTMG